MSPSPSGLARCSTTLAALVRNLSETGRVRKQAIGVAADMGVAAVALWGAYSLRHGYPFDDFRATWHLFLLVPPGTALVFASFGIYRWVIRSTNRKLFRQLAKGAVLSGLLLVLIAFVLPPDRSTPRSLFVIYSMLLLIGAVASRTLWQALFDTDAHGEPIAIYGAGAAGQQLAALVEQGDEYRVKAFVDDDAALRGRTIAGVPVLSGGDGLIGELRRREVGRVVLAIPSLGSVGYQRLLERLSDDDLIVQTMPGITELVSGRARPDEIRDIAIQDILGRQEVAPDIGLMASSVGGKRVLVTGGGGSIGSELCRQIVLLGPERLIVVDNCEANLYGITEELEARLEGLGRRAHECFVPVLLSVTDAPRIERLFAEHAIDTVLHAAAYKHVPIVERQPEQGIEVNVFGTLTVLEAAVAAGVERFTLISTDKAVRPTNAMGATKRVAELILQAKAGERGPTRISMVRFGNVLGSSGSVVPKFKGQIRAGGPVTLTHPDVTRYFMTIPEAAQLVLQATSIAKGGDVFVLDMGEPVRIMDLAKSMVRLYGRKLKSETGEDGDIEIRIDGLRPGEKKYEELFLGASPRATGVAKIATAVEPSLEWAELRAALDALERKSAAGASAESLRAALLSLVGRAVEKAGTDGERASARPAVAANDPTRTSATA